jgi:DNA-3-methyladenine glycosylase
MISSSILPESFYDRPVLDLARNLLGLRLVRILDGKRLAGTIIETEAYRGEEDLACHARVGRTPRTAVMYGTPGRAYVYFTYGMHWMLNCVAEPEGYPAAVLLRAILPVEGREVVAQRRASQPEKRWCNGPGKITSAFGITGSLNTASLFDRASELWIETGEPIPDERVTIGPRVGINNVPEPWFSMPWRFLVKYNGEQPT